MWEEDETAKRTDRINSDISIYCGNVPFNYVSEVIVSAYVRFGRDPEYIFPLALRMVKEELGA